MGFLTGGNKSSSSNQAYNYLSGALSPTVSTGTSANNALANALGVGSDPNGAANGLQNFFNSAGGQFTLQQGNQAINNNAAVHGLLQSGATLKAAQNFGQNTAQQYYQNYLSDLNSVAGNGLNAAGIIGGAGQTTTSSGSPGILGALGNLGQGLGAIGVKVSDRRAKTHIEKLDEMPDGLGIYAFRYVGEPGEQIGVMADEVARIRPWALGPTIGGFRTVDYSRMEAA
jgi:hypothetical protein